MKTIYIDCTQTYLFGGNSGIRRVVRNIANNSKELSNKEVQYKLVIWSGKSFLEIKHVPLINKTFSGRIAEIIKFIYKVYQNYFIPDKPSHQYPRRGIIVKTFYKIVPIWTLFYKKVDFNKGDVLLLADNSWNTPFYNDLIKIDNIGVKIVPIIYDLICINYPQFVQPDLTISFKIFLNEIRKFSKHYITISDVVSKDLINYYKKEGHNISEKDVTSFRLGAELDGLNKNKSISQKIIDIFKKKSTYIVVSTIEPRKNHLHLIDVFNILWDQGVDVQLCIIGKKGWLYENILEKIVSHSEFNKRLFLLNYINDSELDHCYSKSRAVLSPSLIEGFGLPIVEALSKDKIVMASDIDIYHEVGKDYCIYFDVSEPESLANIVKDYEQKNILPYYKTPKDFHWVNWKESLKELMNKIESI